MRRGSTVMARVLYIVHRFWPYAGGSEQMFLELARRSVLAGHDVSVFTTDAWDADHLAEAGYHRIAARTDTVNGVRIRRFRVRHSPVRGVIHRLLQLGFPAHLLRLAPVPLLPGLMWWARFGQREFDLVHAGVFPHLPLFGAAERYCRRHRIPLVCHPMLNLGEPYRADRNQEFLSPAHIRMLAAADRVLTHTNYEAEVLMRKGIRSERISVTPPAVDVAGATGGDGGAFRRRHELSDPIVLQVSTQTADKGSTTTVEALKSLWRAGWSVDLVLIGQVRRDFADYMAAQPAAVRARIRLLDYVDESEKKDAFAACEVFVMPSRADSFGLVYLEAWLNRRPVIGCFAGGVPQVIDDGDDGFLVPFGDAGMLAEYLATLLSDRTRLTHMGERGRAKVIARYDWQRTTRTVLEVYDALLGARPPARDAIRTSC